MKSPLPKSSPCGLLLLLLAAPLPAAAAPRGARAPGTPSGPRAEVTQEDPSAPDAAASDAAAPDAAAPGAASAATAPAGPPTLPAAEKGFGAAAARREAAASAPSPAKSRADQLPSEESELAQHSVGVAVGPLFPLDNESATAPRLALQVTGPLPLPRFAAGPGRRLEWLATVGLRYTERDIIGFTGTSELSTLGAELMPGLRVLSSVHPRLDVSLELSAGLSVLRASSTTRTPAGALDTQDTHLAGVARVALGGQVPLDERLRLYVEPVALHLYAGSRASAAWSMQFGLAYTF